ncbi:hypothetical protein COB57_02605 [Candidatus Peregrinibacteria bacterium]|nr:MAG: hypothetical protein COB57_02605 [Candidatus Peregrinibacteria bacterium]
MKNKHVFIFDDEDFLEEIFIDLIQSCGYTVEACRSMDIFNNIKNIAEDTHKKTICIIDYTYQGDVRDVPELEKYKNIIAEIKKKITDNNLPSLIFTSGLFYAPFVKNGLEEKLLEKMKDEGFKQCAILPKPFELKYFKELLDRM